MMNNNKKYLVSYSLNNNLKSINTIILIAMKEFEEIGQYTEDEANKVIELLHNQAVPEFKEEYEWGSKTFCEWDGFVESNKQKIKELIG